MIASRTKSLYETGHHWRRPGGLGIRVDVAPPRLAGIGVADTVSNGHVDLNSGLVSSLYNPYAAMPSMHVGYALIVAAGVFRVDRHLLVRALAMLYPPFVLLVVVATGNHFFVSQG